MSAVLPITLGATLDFLFSMDGFNNSWPFDDQISLNRLAGIDVRFTELDGSPVGVMTHTPEPGTWLLMLTGFGALVLRRTRRRT